jgi:hypothetical protein
MLSFYRFFIIYTPQSGVRVKCLYICNVNARFPKNHTVVWHQRATLRSAKPWPECRVTRRSSDGRSISIAYSGQKVIYSWRRQKKSNWLVNMGVEPRTLALLAPRSKPTELIDLIRWNVRLTNEIYTLDFSSQAQEMRSRSWQNQSSSSCLLSAELRSQHYRDYHCKPRTRHEVVHDVSQRNWYHFTTTTTMLRIMTLRANKTWMSIGIVGSGLGWWLEQKSIIYLNIIRIYLCTWASRVIRISTSWWSSVRWIDSLPVRLFVPSDQRCSLRKSWSKTLDTILNGRLASVWHCCVASIYRWVHWESVVTEYW